MCVHSPPSLHGWLLQATLGSEREGERFLPRGINRAGHALPRVGPVPLPRGGGGNCTLMVGGGGGGFGEGKEQASWLVTQAWAPHPQCETWHMCHPHLMGGAGRSSEPVCKVPEKSQVLNMFPSLLFTKVRPAGGPPPGEGGLQPKGQSRGSR